MAQPIAATSKAVQPQDKPKPARKTIKTVCCVLLVILFVSIVTVFIIKKNYLLDELCERIDTVQGPISITNVAKAYCKSANKDAEVKLAKPTKSVETFLVCGKTIQCDCR